MVESSDKTWSTGEGNGKPLQHSCLENSLKSMKRQKHMTLKNEALRSVGAQYATGEEWRNNSRNSEEREPNKNREGLTICMDAPRRWIEFWQIAMEKGYF